MRPAREIGANLVIGRPFFNTETGADDAELVSVPNELDGTVHVNSTAGAVRVGEG